MEIREVEQKLKEIESRRQAIGKPNWKFYARGGIAGMVQGLKFYGSEMFPVEIARFIAHSPQDVDFLIALVRELTKHPIRDIVTKDFEDEHGLAG